MSLTAATGLHTPVPLGSRFNHGLQEASPLFGGSVYAVDPQSLFHRTLSQRLALTGDLWADFGRVPVARHRPRSRSVHVGQQLSRSVDRPSVGTRCTSEAQERRKFPRKGVLDTEAREMVRSEELRAQPQSELRQPVAPLRTQFLGFAVTEEIDYTRMGAGEIDRICMRAAASKYPMGRPATFAEFAVGGIRNLPALNSTAHPCCFVGPDSFFSDRTVFNNTHARAQKKCILPGEPLGKAQRDVAADAMLVGIGHSRFVVPIVVPVARTKLQPSCQLFGMARGFGINGEECAGPAAPAALLRRVHLG